MKRIILIMAYYGKLPNTFDFWLQSVRNNPSIDFYFISDCIGKEKMPSNVKILNISIVEFKRRIGEKFDFDISLDNYGRISQFRPAFAYIFPEIVEGYDFWGFVECDLILGDIRKFITDEILDHYEKIFKLGHIQIFKNNSKMNTLFMQKTYSALNYKYAFSKNILFFEEIIGMTNIANAKGIKTYAENVFSDLNMFELMFVRGNFTYKELALQEQLFEYDNGKLFSYSVEDETIQKREILYVHFQKRILERDTVDLNKYVIVPNRFTTWEKIDKEYFRSIKKKISGLEDAYRESMRKKLLAIKKERLKTFEWKMLYLIRFRVFLFGGIDLSGVCWRKKTLI